LVALLREIIGICSSEVQRFAKKSSLKTDISKINFFWKIGQKDNSLKLQKFNILNLNLITFNHVKNDARKENMFLLNKHSVFKSFKIMCILPRCTYAIFLDFYWSCLFEITMHISLSMRASIYFLVPTLLTYSLLRNRFFS